MNCTVGIKMHAMPTVLLASKHVPHELYFVGISTHAMQSVLQASDAAPCCLFSFIKHSESQLGKIIITCSMATYCLSTCHHIMAA